MAEERPDAVKEIVTEAAARAWLIEHFDVSRETMDRLSLLESLVRAEASKQNLVSAATLDQFWSRHIVDSAQLLKHVTVAATDQWLDLGTGAGFPGLVVAIMARCDITLVESRARRISFLEEAVDALDIAGHAAVAGCRLESLETRHYDIISARAFAPLPRLLAIAGRFSADDSRWLLPKGRNAQVELETIPKKWQHMFHVERSVTDADALILIGRGQYTGK